MSISLKRSIVEEQDSISLNPTLLKDIFAYAKPFGHNEDAKSLNLGFGYIYYGLVRTFTTSAHSHNRLGVWL